MTADVAPSERGRPAADDDVLAEMATLKGWLKQSYVAVAPKTLGRKL